MEQPKPVFTDEQDFVFDWVLRNLYLSSVKKPNRRYSAFYLKAYMQKQTGLIMEERLFRIVMHHAGFQTFFSRDGTCCWYNVIDVNIPKNMVF